MPRWGESYSGPIGKPKKIVGGKRLGHIDPAEVGGVRPSKSPGKGLKPHLVPLHDELSRHIRLNTLRDSGYSSDLLSHINPGEHQDLHAKIALMWLAEHQTKLSKTSTLAPLTLDQLCQHAVERQFIEPEELGPRPKQSAFWKKFVAPLTRNGWIRHDAKTGSIQLDEGGIRASLESHRIH